MEREFDYMLKHYTVKIKQHLEAYFVLCCFYHIKICIKYAQNNQYFLKILFILYNNLLTIVNILGIIYIR